MRRIGICTLLAALSLSGAALASTADDVRGAVERMDNWLGQNPNADAWRKQLLHNELLAELAKEGAANRGSVAAILARFESRKPGLELGPFRTVRAALQRWADELQVSELDRLAAKVDTAATLRPLTDGQVRSARSRVVQAADQLERFLARGTARNARAWKDYLRWSQLQQQLADSAGPDAEQVGNVASRYYSGKPGLELSPFVEMREALLGYHRLLTHRSSPELSTQLADQLQALRQALVGARERPADAAAEIAVRLEWLEQLGQSPDLVARIRQLYSRPNLYASVSADAMTRRFNSPVSQTTSVHETILGTPVRGVAHTVGIMSARLIPSDDLAVVELTMNGTSTSDTVGYHPPVTIFSDGTTQVLARKRLLIDEVGIRSEPATAECSTSTTTKGIQTANRLGARFIRRAAQKRIAAQKPQAERISARLAEARVARQMDQQALDVIAASNGRLETKVRRPLLLRNLYPRAFRCWTTDQRLHVTAVQGRASQLGAPTTPPDSPAHDLLVQVHESFFQNTSLNAIGGLQLTDVQARDLVQEATGEVPEQLQIKPDEDPWSIMFDRTQPLTLRFHGNQVTIALRGRQFTRGDQELRQVMQVSATYKIETVGGRARLTRQGDLDVSYPGRENDRLSLQELRNKTFMAGKFEGLFKQEFSGEGLKLPERWQKLGDVTLDYIAAQDGWLTLGWN